MKRAVVTAIYGDYEPLKVPAVVDPRWEYWCVTDAPRLVENKGPWRPVVRPAGTAGPTRASRQAKVTIHRIVPGAEVTLWIDGSFELLVAPGEIVKAMGITAGGPAIGCFQHHERSDIYAEGRACAELLRDDPVIIAEQLRRYRTMRYQSRWLSENGMMVRQMTPAIVELGERWWAEIERGSYRDQLSFPVVCDELGIVPVRLPMNIRKTSFARFHSHHRARQRRARALGEPRVPPAAPRVPPAAPIERPTVYEVLAAARASTAGAAVVHAAIAYDAHMDLGRAYNRVMERLGDEEWAVFLDHDAMFTTSAWYHQIRAAMAAHPEAGVFTAVTNRVGAKHQRLRDRPLSPDDHDMRRHRARGEELFAEHYADVIDITDEQPFSGVVIVISKKAWRAVEGFKSGFLGVDTRLHVELARKGYRVYLMPGLYVYHWYRADAEKPAHMRLLGPDDRLPYEP